MRVLALDYGAARCGVAVSDPTGTLATPLDAVVRPGSTDGLQSIVALVRDRNVETVVVGLPLTLAGDESEQTTRARAFAERLGRAVAPVPVELYDERLTTAQARRTGGAASEDSRAAAHLLEAWLAARDARGRPG
ncbi:MAG TPA: Holliday junction resolvase RuvX [Solirubrobacteraceae bacterium]|nr:Holliday junction resolvase RuvX [Solirubrobacteraceae bacterium]